MKTEARETTHISIPGLVGIGPLLRQRSDDQEVRTHLNPPGLVGIGPLLRQRSDEQEVRTHLNPLGLLGFGPVMTRTTRPKHASVPISLTLRDALRTQGWWPLARSVKIAEGLAPPNELTLPGVVASLATKIAADHSNEQQIQEGLQALRRLRGQ